MTPRHTAPRAPRERATRSRFARALLLVAPAAVLAAMIAAGEARSQSCDASQAQLTQAIVDSQTALDRTEAQLAAFDQALIAPRTGALDTAPVVAARASIDGFVSALNNFRGQVAPISQSCGPAFAGDVATLDSLVARFEAQRARADQLLADHQAQLDSGEPVLDQQQMETVQRVLAGQGHFTSVIDGRFGSGTRAAIRAWQAANGMPATGYLTAAQAQQLLAAPAPAQPQMPDVAGLPPAPQLDGQAPVQVQPAAPAPDAQTQQVCADNGAQVDIAASRTQEFRQQASARSETLRTAIRASRTGGFDATGAEDLQGDVDNFLDQMVAFQNQARTIAGRCGDAYDASLAGLDRDIEVLRQLGVRVDQLVADYRGLASSGEPVLSTQQMRAIQQGLAARGHYTGAIDALFGPGTRNAIRAYQADIGAQATGYLTPEQADELQRPVVAAAGPVPSVDAPDTISSPDAATTVTVADVQRRLAEELVLKQPVEPLSGVTAADGSFGEAYAALAAALSGDRPQLAVDRRFGLLGAAYMERSAESLEMIDAHMLVAEAYVALGLYGDAATQLQRAYGIWQTLEEGDPSVAARLQERLATVRLAQELADGEPDPAVLETATQQLAAAREAATRELGADDPLTLRLVDRMADIAAATGAAPADPEVEAALSARYGS